MGAEAVKVQDIVGLEPETNIKDGVVTVSFPAEAYVNLANSVGIDEKTLKESEVIEDGKTYRAFIVVHVDHVRLIDNLRVI